MGGVILPDSAKERPLSGLVVRCGPGKHEEDGTRKAPKVRPTCAHEAAVRLAGRGLMALGLRLCCILAGGL